jgi:glycosyltransferase involved in cell wall biosynthesis
MCFEKPIICSVCDGTEKDLVREGFNGMYFKEGDAGDLANKIKYLFDNPTIVKQMGLNSLSIIKNEININTVVERYRVAFNSLHARVN